MSSEQNLKQKIMRRFIEEEFLTPVELAEVPRDVELLVAQEMIKIIDKIFTRADQENFLDKLQAYRTNLLTQKVNERRLLGKTLTQDGVTYMLAILCKIV